MEIRRLSNEEAAVRRYAEELRVPFHRDLAATVESYDLAVDDEADFVEAELAFCRDRLDADDYRLWVAVDAVGDADRRDGASPPDASPAAVEGAFAGFVATDIDEAPPVFDRPDRVVVNDVYVRDAYRGTGLATDLMDRAAEHAREAGCSQIALDVDVDNERAVAFYEKLGFEPSRYRMTAPVDEI